MVWVPKSKEIGAMLAAEGKRRYEYFIHRICDARKVWGLYEHGWATLGGGRSKLIPFWPHQLYAKRFKGEEWSAYDPKEIDLNAFLDRWIPGMRRDGTGAAIFPVGSRSFAATRFSTPHCLGSESGSRGDTEAPSELGAVCLKNLGSQRPGVRFRLDLVSTCHVVI